MLICLNFVKNIIFNKIVNSNAYNYLPQHISIQNCILFVAPQKKLHVNCILNFFNWAEFLQCFSREIIDIDKKYIANLRNKSKFRFKALQLFAVQTDILRSNWCYLFSHFLGSKETVAALRKKRRRKNIFFVAFRGLLAN